MGSFKPVLGFFASEAAPPSSDGRGLETLASLPMVFSDAGSGDVVDWPPHRTASATRIRSAAVRLVIADTIPPPSSPHPWLRNTPGARDTLQQWPRTHSTVVCRRSRPRSSYHCSKQRCQCACQPPHRSDRRRSRQLHRPYCPSHQPKLRPAVPARHSQPQHPALAFRHPRAAHRLRPRRRQRDFGVPWRYCAHRKRSPAPTSARRPSRIVDTAPSWIENQAGPRSGVHVHWSAERGAVVHVADRSSPIRSMPRKRERGSVVPPDGREDSA